MSVFGKPGDLEYERLVAENSFITHLQLEIEAALEDMNVTQAELAKLLGVSEPRISQILSDNGANLQARTIARIAHALGMRAAIIFEELAARQVEISIGKVSDGEEFAEWVRIASETIEREHGSIAAAAVNANDWVGPAAKSERSQEDLVAA